jgi:hypothetical protein
MDDLAGVRGTSTDDPSGFSLAEQAHEAGAVTAPAELPTFTVALELRIHAGKLEAETLAYAIADTLSGHPLIVPPVALSIQVREQ